LSASAAEAEAIVSISARAILDLDSIGISCVGPSRIQTGDAGALFRPGRGWLVPAQECERPSREGHERVFAALRRVIARATREQKKPQAG
jgi:hypothetical protein